MSRTRKDCAPKYEQSPKYNDYWPWWMSEPHWWRNMMKTRRRRAELRRTLHMAMVADVDDVVWPCDVKPHVYYW